MPNRDDVQMKLQQLKTVLDYRRLVHQIGDDLLKRCDFSFRHGSELAPLFGFDVAITNEQVIYLWVESHLEMPFDNLVELLQYELNEIFRSGWADPT